MEDTPVPYGTRYLLITCSRPEDRQFAGIERTCALLSRADRVHHLSWTNRPLGLEQRRTLKAVVISGHGARTYPRVSDRHTRRIHPRDLLLPPRVPVYLLACNQGLRPIRERWSDETGGLAFGCEGETESLLSTLLLLGLLDHGLASLHRWFIRWRLANNRLRKHFPTMRHIYREHRKNWSAALETIQKKVDLGPFDDILAVARRRHRILSGLGPEQRQLLGL
jgi:hypothetical protein